MSDILCGIRLGGLGEIEGYVRLGTATLPPPTSVSMVHLKSVHYDDVHGHQCPWCS